MGRSGTTTDFTDRLTRLLGPGETLLAHCLLVRDGEPVPAGGAIAASFARFDAPLVLGVTNVYLSFWDFGPTGEEQPALRSQLPREYVASFADTGENALMGFTDGSFVTWRLTGGPGFFTEAGFQHE